MELTGYDFTEEESKEYKDLVSKKIGSFQAQSEDMGGEVEYRGLPFYPEFAKDGVEADLFSSKSEIDRYLEFQEKVEKILMGSV